MFEKLAKKQPAWARLRQDQRYTYRNRSIFSGSSIFCCFPANCSAIQARISVHFSILAVRSARLGRILNCYDDSESIPCSIVRLPPPFLSSLADQTPRVFRSLRIPIIFWWCFLLVFPSLCPRFPIPLLYSNTIPAFLTPLKQVWSHLSSRRTYSSLSPKLCYEIHRIVASRNLSWFSWLRPPNPSPSLHSSTFPFVHLPFSSLYYSDCCICYCFAFAFTLLPFLHTSRSAHQSNKSIRVCEYHCSIQSIEVDQWD